MPTRRIHTTRFALLSLFLWATCLPAQAQFLVAVRESSDVLVSIDPNTLVITPVGPLGTSFNFGGLAYDPFTETLYMIGGRGNNALYTVNITTGAATLVGSHGVTDLLGLEFDTSTGTLYASQFSRGSSIYTLNPTTGAATLLGNPGIGLGGLAYDSARDILVGVNDGNGDLYSINRSTGALTLLFNGPSNNNSGLAYDPLLDRLWNIDWSGNLFYYSPSNGYARTTALTGLGSHDGLAFIGVPEPSTNLLIGLGMVLFAARRYRRTAG